MGSVGGYHTWLKENRGERTDCSKEITSSEEAGSLEILWGRTTKVQPPSTEGTPIEVVKMQRTTKSGDSGFKKKRNTSNNNKTIGHKKSISDDEESQAEEVVDLEKMEKTPLKAKGTKDSTKKAKAKKDKGKGNAPD